MSLARLSLGLRRMTIGARLGELRAEIDLVCEKNGREIPTLIAGTIFTVTVY